jgi:hypothetical protein
MCIMASVGICDFHLWKKFLSKFGVEGFVVSIVFRALWNLILVGYNPRTDHRPLVDQFTTVCVRMVYGVQCIGIRMDGSIVNVSRWMNFDLLSK